MKLPELNKRQQIALWVGIAVYAFFTIELLSRCFEDIVRKGTIVSVSTQIAILFNT